MDDNFFILHEDHKPSRADAVQNRILLLETAQLLFAEKGVDSVSMAAIAQAANVGKGTLYRHFENKGELCQALLDQDQRDLQERTLHRLRTVQDPLDNLRWFLVQVAMFVDKNSELLCASSKETLLLSLEHPAHFWWRHTIRQLLTQLNPSGDIDYMTDVLYVMLDVHTIFFQNQVLGYDFQRITDGLIETLLRLIN